MVIKRIENGLPRKAWIAAKLLVGPQTKNLSILSFLLLSIASHAQDYSVCDSVIQNGLKEAYIKLDSGENLNQIYSKHCAQSSRVSSSDRSLGLSAVIKSIPLKLRAGARNDREAMDSFCKEFQSSQYSKYETSEYNSKGLPDYHLT